MAALALGSEVAGESMLRAQELLLSGSAQGLSDLAVRACRSPARRRSRLTSRARRGASASRASTWKRMPARSLHEGFRDSEATPTSTATAAACRWSRSSPSPTCARPPKRRRIFDALREILVSLGVNDGNMEEGSLRCDANVSVRPMGQQKLGTEAEVKNVNSFRFVQQGHRVRDRRGRSTCWQGAAVSCRKRGCSTRRRATRTRCAARKKRTTTATFPSRICRRWS